MRFTCFFILLTVLLYFGVLTYGTTWEDTWSRKSDDTANKITKVLFDKLHKKYDLVGIGTGGAVRDTIHQLLLSFQLYQQVPPEETRELIIDIIDTCLNKINSYPGWAYYFTDYPVKVDTLKIQVWIHKPDYSSFDIGTVSYVTMNEGKWYYALVVPEGVAEFDSPEETYEEAANILSAQRREPITK